MMPAIIDTKNPLPNDRKSKSLCDCNVICTNKPHSQLVPTGTENTHSDNLVFDSMSLLMYGHLLQRIWVSIDTSGQSGCHRWMESTSLRVILELAMTSFTLDVCAETKTTRIALITFSSHSRVSHIRLANHSMLLLLTLACIASIMFVSRRENTSQSGNEACQCVLS